MCALLASVVGAAAPTRTSPLVVAPNDVVFVVNPDSNTVARLDFSGIAGGTLTHEAKVGGYPRTVTLAGTWVYTADEKGDSITRCDQAGPDENTCTHKSLGVGCNPYGVVATPLGDRLVVSCQGTSEVVVLSTDMTEQARVKLAYPKARAIAVSSDGLKAYVTHFITEEPGTDGHVSVVDLANKGVANVYTVAADLETCETQNSGQGVLNQLSAIALIPDGAPGEVAGQLWVGGEQENNVSKGLFKRDPEAFADCKIVKKKGKKTAVCTPKPATRLFPLLTFKPFPADGPNRDKYQASFHDIIRFGIVKLDAATGNHVGKLDIDEAAIATDIEFSADGTTAFVVDQTFNSFHIFNTKKGQGSDVTTLFAGPGAFGPGGADPSAGCIPAALPSITSEVPYRMAPQAGIVTIDGHDPVDAQLNAVDTGVDFDTAAYHGSKISRMRAVPDGIGTVPMGVRVSPTGDRAYVYNYLARNVVVVGTPTPRGPDGKPENLRCCRSGPTGCVPEDAVACETDTDCPVSQGFCNHPGGNACTQDKDCGTEGPCVRNANCVPLVLQQPVSTITGKCAGGANDGAACKSSTDCASGVCNGIAGDPMAPSVLDGKILFTTAARDASVPNGIGLGSAAPLFNAPQTTCASGAKAGQPCLRQEDCGDKTQRLCSVGHSLPGEVVSVAHDASYVSCTTCHADFGGQDGRTWDFSQFGASLRNTMDLRGRASFAPGTCGGGPNAGATCTFDAQCGDGFTCKADPTTIPGNIKDSEARGRWFNPMQSIHWNGDRDEVEDFEFTFRSLQGSGDCDGVEDIPTACMGALVQRDSSMTNELPRTNSAGKNDVEPDLGAPNRNLPGTNGSNVGVRLTHVADFVYSLTDFVKNPNQPNDATERGRAIFSDPLIRCTECHDGGKTGQFFTDKKPAGGFDGSQAARGDTNNPFLRHDVGTGNLFDDADPYQVGLQRQILQNANLPIPAPRGSLSAYVTPVLNDLWNTAPYLHDGTAHTLLDVVRPCDADLDDCTRLGAGRAIHGTDTPHGKTDVLTPKQLNDLVAFQKVLTTSTELGARNNVVKAGTMSITNAKLTFGKVKKGTRGPASFKFVGTFGGAPVTANLAGGVALQLGTPGGGTMVLFERTIPMQAHGSRFVGETTDGGGKVKLSIRTKGDTSRFVLVGRDLDLAALDTGNPDVTVAFVVGEAQFVRNRTLAAKKSVYTLPKKKKQKA
jgi:DNA-binding beta-propeller fold protein YncE